MTAADEKARIWGADRRVAKATDRIFMVGTNNLCSVGNNIASCGEQVFDELACFYLRLLRVLMSETETKK